MVNGTMRDKWLFIIFFPEVNYYIIIETSLKNLKKSQGIFLRNYSSNLAARKESSLRPGIATRIKLQNMDSVNNW